jgi:hypothetical protein
MITAISLISSMSLLLLSAKLYTGLKRDMNTLDKIIQEARNKTRETLKPKKDVTYIDEEDLL